VPQSGFIRQEDISLKDFLENRFGEVYARREAALLLSVPGSSQL
jgi:hypothetical protein